MPEIQENKFEHLYSLGRFNRFVVQKQKNKVNNRFRQYLSDNGSYLPGFYGAPHPTYEAEIACTKKYDKKYPLPTETMLHENVAILKKYFGPLPFKPVALAEAVTSFDLSTSMGFPFNLWYKNKYEWLCANDLEYWFDRYQQAVQMYPDSYSVVFNSFLKMDEVRPVVKLEQNKIRQVNGPHFFFLLMQCCLFKTQNDYLKQTRATHPQKIGINIFGKELQLMWDRLASFRWKISEDVTAFDSCVSPAQFASLSLWRSEHADEFNSFWIDHCYKQVSFAPFVTTRGFLFLKQGGNVSGQWCTGEDNSHVNCLLREHFYRRAQIPDADHVDYVYGDDGAHGSSQKLDLNLMAQVYSEHGFELRDLMQSEKLEDIVFLQRVPFNVNGTWLTRHADGRKALDSLYLLNENLSYDTQFQRACGIRLAYFYNYDVYWKIDAWCHYMLKHYPLTPSVKSSYLSTAQIRNLYLHYEP